MMMVTSPERENRAVGRVQSCFLMSSNRRGDLPTTIATAMETTGKAVKPTTRLTSFIKFSLFSLATTESTP